MYPSSEVLSFLHILASARELEKPLVIFPERRTHLLTNRARQGGASASRARQQWGPARRGLALHSAGHWSATPGFPKNSILTIRKHFFLSLINGPVIQLIFTDPSSHEVPGYSIGSE